MGKPPVVRDTLLNILGQEGKFTFTQLLSRVNEALGRTVSRGSVSKALGGLLRDGLVEEIIQGRRKLFQLSRLPTLVKAQGVLGELIKLHDPRGIYLEERLVILTDPLQAQRIREAPRPPGFEELAAELIVEALVGKQPGRFAGIINMIAWAAWAGWRHEVEGPEGPEWEALRQHINLREYTKRLLEARRGVDEHLEVLRREAVMAMASAAEAQSLRELIPRLNLAQLKQQKARLALEEQYLASHQWSRDHEEALRDIEFLANVIEEYWPSYTLEELGIYDLCSPEVFRAVLRKLFEHPEDAPPNVGGDYASSRAQMEALKRHYLQDLRAALANQRIIYVRLHGVSLREHEVATYIYNSFEQWLHALKEGHLDHRTWLFQRSTIRKVARALRLVKRNKPPEPVMIDMEGWTLWDLHKYHPRGSDPTFWEGLLRALEEAARRVRSSGP